MSAALSRPRIAWLQATTVVAVLGIVAFSGWRNSQLIPLVLGAVGCLALALKRPAMGLALIPIVAIYVPLELKVSTVVALNVALVMVPAFITIYAVSALRHRSFDTIPGQIARPLALFIFSTTLSLLLGNVYWDPNVPRPENVWAVQIGQWSIYVFSMSALWLAAVQLRSERTLKLVTYSYIVAGGMSAFLFIFPFTASVADKIVVWGSAFSPYWSWMAAILTSQLFFNRKLRVEARVFIVAALIGVWYLALRDDMTTWLSGFVPMLVVTAVLVAIRFPRLAGIATLLSLMLIIIFRADLMSALSNSSELRESGGGRYGHWSVVWEFARTRPVFGLGLAAYRHYSWTRPDLIARYVFTNAGISTHNNYYDIFAFMGVFGLAAFVWLAVALSQLGLRLVRGVRREATFDEAYAAGVLAGLAGMLVGGLLGDWFLPFVYNIGFPGVRSSLMAWVFLGGMVALATWRKLA